MGITAVFCYTSRRLIIKRNTERRRDFTELHREKKEKCKFPLLFSVNLYAPSVQLSVTLTKGWCHEARHYWSARRRQNDYF